MITLVAALARNRCIGKDGQLVWHNKEDMARFKALTSGPDKTVLMGRKTWESIPPKFRPLPDRKNVVISRNTGLEVPPGVLCFDDLETAILVFGEREQLFVIGGGEIYAATLPHADMLELTEIDYDIAGDTFFPEFDKNEWMETGRHTREGFAFVSYSRTSRA